MSEWSLSQLLSGLHDDIQQKLATVRRSFGHPGTKGDASEAVWLELLQTYLPKRYSAASAHVVDSLGTFSDQIDVVVFDRQYSPFIFSYQGQTIIPAEERLCCLRGEAGDQRGPSRLCAQQGCERPPPASHKSSYPARGRRLPAQAFAAHSGRSVDFGKRLDAAARRRVNLRAR